MKFVDSGRAALLYTPSQNQHTQENGVLFHRSREAEITINKPQPKSSALTLTFVSLRLSYESPLRRSPNVRGWLSWDIAQEGFLRAFNPVCFIRNISLLQALKVSWRKYWGAVADLMKILVSWLALASVLSELLIQEKSMRQVRTCYLLQVNDLESIDDSDSQTIIIFRRGGQKRQSPYFLSTVINIFVS